MNQEAIAGEGDEDRDAGRRGMTTAMDKGLGDQVGAAFCLLNAGKLTWSPVSGKPVYDSDDETEFLAGVLEMRRTGRYGSNDCGGGRGNRE